ncbi:hypothetical protein ABIF72_004339 [Bradyrhizobium japonicum]
MTQSEAFCPVSSTMPLALDAEEGEVALDMGDQGQIGAVADGVEADEVGEEVANAIGS